MELLLKRVIIMMIAISVAVPSIYFSFSYYKGSQYEKDPTNYLPSNTNFVAMIKSGASEYYIFAENSTPGVLASISVFSIPQMLDSSESASNITDNITLRYYEEYRGVSIFQIDGINAWEIMEEFLNNSTELAVFLNSTDVYYNLTDLTFFIASPQNSFSIIGNVQLLQDSIDAFMDHESLKTSRNISFDSISNVSLYYFPGDFRGLEHLSLNMTYTTTELYMNFNHLNSTVLLEITSLAQEFGFQVYIHQNSIEIISGNGVQGIQEFLKEYGGLIKSLAGVPLT